MDLETTSFQTSRCRDWLRALLKWGALDPSADLVRYSEQLGHLSLENARLRAEIQTLKQVDFLDQSTISSPSNR